MFHHLPSTHRVADWAVFSVAQPHLQELAAPFGLNHPDSVSNLIRRAEQQLAQSPKDRNLAVTIVESVTKTENRV
jgi:hypothetical protein